MGLALAAELNGYPGPLHVLDLAQELQLTAEQRRKTRVLFEAMRAETSALGAELIEAERTARRGLEDLLLDGRRSRRREAEHEARSRL